MKIQIKLFSRFRAYLPPEARGQTTIELPDGSTIAQLLEVLALQSRVKLITINNEPETDSDRILCDGDAVHVFPVVVGG